MSSTIRYTSGWFVAIALAMSDQRPLPLPDRRDQVDDPGRHPARLRLQVELVLRVERCQVVEQDLVPGRLGLLEVDRLDLEEREVAFALLGRTDLSGDRVAGAEVEASDLRGGDVDVVRAREVVLVRCAQEPESVRERLEHALREDLPLLLGLRLEDGEDQILLAHAGGVLDVHVFRQLGELVDLLLLELLDVEALAPVAVLFRRVGLLLEGLVVHGEVAHAARVAPVAPGTTAAPSAAAAVAGLADSLRAHGSSLTWVEEFPGRLRASGPRLFIRARRHRRKRGARASPGSWRVGWQSFDGFSALVRNFRPGS
jgi:hypothetical protein